jgi:DNA-binding transcriptional MerR regulator
MRIFRLALAGAVCIAWLAGAALAGDAEGELSPHMTPPEIDKRADDLTAKGWKGRDISAALSISKRNRQLFEIYVGLYDKRIPPLSIQKSFALCKGEPADINEYWDWILNYKFDPREVEEVFARFPPVKMTRYFYFAYRAGDVAGLEAKKRAEGPAAAEAAGYSKKECMAIFRATRFQMDYVKEYFELRHDGKAASEAWTTIREKLLAEIQKRKEEAQKQAEEEKERIQAQLEAEKKAREEAAKANPPVAKSSEDSGKKTSPRGGIQIEELDELLGTASDTADQKGQHQPDTGEQEEPAQPPADDKEQQPKQEAGSQDQQEQAPPPAGEADDEPAEETAKPQEGGM